MNRIVHHYLRLECDPQQAFSMFTANEHLASWLCWKADVEAHLGGRYELFWREGVAIQGTPGCVITAFQPGQLLAFTWKGPNAFAPFMHYANPLTQVVVSFAPVPDSPTPMTDVHLVHLGWGSTPQWEEARRWFERAWRGALSALAQQVNECAALVA